MNYNGLDACSPINVMLKSGYPDILLMVKLVLHYSQQGWYSL